MQCLDDLLFGFAPQPEDQERITIELLGQKMIDGSYLLAGFRPIGAGAIRLQIRALPGKNACGKAKRQRFHPVAVDAPREGVHKKVFQFRVGQGKGWE
jgi:hypothetical protein